MRGFFSKSCVGRSVRRRAMDAVSGAEGWDNDAGGAGGWVCVQRGASHRMKDPLSARGRTPENLLRSTVACRSVSLGVRDYVDTTGVPAGR